MAYDPGLVLELHFMIRPLENAAEPLAINFLHIKGSYRGESSLSRYSNPLSCTLEWWGNTDTCFARWLGTLFIHSISNPQVPALVLWCRLLMYPNCRPAYFLANPCGIFPWATKFPHAPHVGWRSFQGWSRNWASGRGGWRGKSIHSFAQGMSASTKN